MRQQTHRRREMTVGVKEVHAKPGLLHRHREIQLADFGRSVLPCSEGETAAVSVCQRLRWQDRAPSMRSIGGRPHTIWSEAFRFFALKIRSFKLSPSFET